MTLVTDGCIAHVSLKIDPQTFLAASDAKVYAIVEKRSKDVANQKLIDQELVETKKTEVAETAIQDDLCVALHALVNMQKLPELIDPEDKLVIRLLLCKV